MKVRAWEAEQPSWAGKKPIKEEWPWETPHAFARETERLHQGITVDRKQSSTYNMVFNHERTSELPKETENDINTLQFKKCLCNYAEWEKPISRWYAWFVYINNYEVTLTGMDSRLVTARV